MRRYALYRVPILVTICYCFITILYCFITIWQKTRVLCAQRLNKLLVEEKKCLQLCASTEGYLQLNVNMLARYTPNEHGEHGRKHVTSYRKMPSVCFKIFRPFLLDMERLFLLSLEAPRPGIRRRFLWEVVKCRDPTPFTINMSKIQCLRFVYNCIEEVDIVVAHWFVDRRFEASISAFWSPPCCFFMQPASRSDHIWTAEESHIDAVYVSSRNLSIPTSPRPKEYTCFKVDNLLNEPHAVL